MTTDSILDEAARIIDGDRAKAYGDPTEMCQRIADLWAPILRARFRCIAGPDTEQVLDIRPQDVALCLLQLKVAREINRPGRDNRVDMAGYAAILDRVQPKDEKSVSVTVHVDGAAMADAAEKAFTGSLGSIFDNLRRDAARARRPYERPKYHTGGIVGEAEPRRYGETSGEQFVPKKHAPGKDDVTRKGNGFFARPNDLPFVRRWAAKCAFDFSKPKTNSGDPKTDFENGKAQAETSKREATRIPTEGWWSIKARWFTKNKLPLPSESWRPVRVFLSGSDELEREEELDDSVILARGVMLRGTDLFWPTQHDDYLRIADMPAAVLATLVGKKG